MLNIASALCGVTTGAAVNVPFGFVIVIECVAPTSNSPEVAKQVTVSVPLGGTVVDET